MKKSLIYLSLSVLTLIVIVISQSCKKGENDPVVSLRSRQDRFTNNWILTKMEKNGINIDVSNSIYSYSIAKNGSYTQTVHGKILGYPSRTVKDGIWEFANNDGDVKISSGNHETVYNVQRLAAKELWLKELKRNDVYVYFFEGN